MIDVSDLDQTEVFMTLYNRAQPQGMGFLQYVSQPITHDEARVLLASARKYENEPYFDYVHGRVMKIRLSSEIDPCLYDRDNGPGSADEAIQILRKTGDPAHPAILDRHKASMVLSALDTIGAAQAESDKVTDGPGWVTLEKGMPAVAGFAAQDALDEC